MVTARMIRSLICFYRKDIHHNSETEIVLAKDNTVTVTVRNNAGDSLYHTQRYYDDRKTAYDYISGYFNLPVFA
jgi:hypothetical protein